MDKISHKDIQEISRRSNWSVSGVEKALKTYVYSDKKAWYKFLNLFLLSLGVGFTVSGIVFFFAYNWDSLDKFVKLGLVEGLVILTTLAALMLYRYPLIKKIVLTGAAVLVGVLFAVFGQVYQTGANAYDFFLGWTLFVTLWVLIANFPPMWLVYITLVNTTLILYAEQVAHGWSDIFVFTLLFGLNSAILIGFLWLSHHYKSLDIPPWFTQVVALTTLSFSTLGIIAGIFEDYDPAFPVILGMAVILYGWGIKYGFDSMRLFYLSAIPFSVIIVISALLLEIYDGANMFFAVGVFVVMSVTLVIKGLINLQKKWKDG